MSNVSRGTFFNSQDFFGSDNEWVAWPEFDVDLSPWQFLTIGVSDLVKSKILPNVAGIPRNSDGRVLQTITILNDDHELRIAEGAYLIGNDIQLATEVQIESCAWIKGPTRLGKGTVIRHGAYVRGGVWTGQGCIVGHSSEIKNSMMGQNSKIPHFNYVGDSIIGSRVNLGAGTKVSNLKLDHKEVYVRFNEHRIATGLKKFGAVIGDDVETGCNSVLNPGTVLAANCKVLPCVAVSSGYYSTKTIIADK